MCLCRFFCDTEQSFYSTVTWLSSHGCGSFVPKLFAIPSFRPALEALFPDASLTYTQLYRSMMLPNNFVWERTKAVKAAYLDKANVQVTKTWIPIFAIFRIYCDASLHPHFTIMCNRNNPALLEESVVAPSILPKVMNYITGERIEESG